MANVLTVSKIINKFKQTKSYSDVENILCGLYNSLEFSNHHEMNEYFKDWCERYLDIDISGGCGDKNFGYGATSYKYCMLAAKAITKVDTSRGGKRLSSFLTHLASFKEDE